MESSPASLRSRRICRFCLSNSEPLNFIYKRTYNKPVQVPLPLQIMSCVAIEVYAEDEMPQVICNMCRWNLDRSYKFKLQCKKADEALRDYLLSGVLPKPFPPIPIDPPTEISNKRPAESRSQNQVSKKQRTSDNNSRDTIERHKTRERKRERERERQNQKHRENASEQHLYKEKRDRVSEGKQKASNKENKELESAKIRVHACNQCERTFPLEQALLLHVQRVHRARNYKCNECERTCFTKCDLRKHMSIHLEVKPYSCSICQKQFSRLISLQRHNKVHRNETRYACFHCDCEFFTMEELEKHKNLVHKVDEIEKPFRCNICNKRFRYKQGMQRHKTLHNNKNKKFVCDYCQEGFRTSTKLARHLSTHAGPRPHMCKLCPRTFLLSHHLTRHMRAHLKEKRYVYKNCDMESLEVNQLTHMKRKGMGLICDVCHESCRNRADYVIHIKQHIEADKKMNSNDLQIKTEKNFEPDFNEKGEKEDQHADGDDNKSPVYVMKKLPKQPSESEKKEEKDREDKEVKSEGQKEEECRVVYVRGKDGNMVKITTLIPIQRHDVQEQKVTKQTTSIGFSSQSSSKSLTSSQIKDSSKSGHVDDSEIQMLKIATSELKEHKTSLKHQQNNQDQSKESLTSMVRFQSSSQESHKDNDKTETLTSTPKTVEVKRIKRIIMKKPAENSNEGTSTSTSDMDGDSSLGGTDSHKVKRMIVSRIVRLGEVIINPDNTMIDPTELTKLSVGNVVKLPLDKNQNLIQAVLQSMKQRQKTGVIANKKFELKTSVSSSGDTPKNLTASKKLQLIAQDQDQKTQVKVEVVEEVSGTIKTEY